MHAPRAPTHDRNFSMSRSDVFALKSTGLNPFLFAEVGTESNGSMLTVLSVLARLGQDPWAQAAQWAKLPKADIIERLASSIAQMPLPPQALRDARQTASRLILLLPAFAGGPKQAGSATATQPTLPRWVPASLVAVALALSIGAMLLGTQAATNTAVAPLAQIQPLSPNAPTN
jgi:hypothetical protein